VTLARIILEYFKAFLTWPVAAFAMFFVFVCLFKKQIRIFLENMKELRLLGLQIKQGQEQSSTKESVDQKIADNLKQEGITLTNDQIHELANEFNALQQKKMKLKKKLKMIKICYVTRYKGLSFSNRS
jgi:hypothetical protein